MKTTLLTISILVIFMTSAFTQTGTITGTVTDQATGKIIAYAQISLKQSGKEIQKTNTDIGGNYLFASVPVGKYLLKATSSGYTDLVRSSVVVSEGKTTTMLLQLKTPALALADQIISKDAEEIISNESMPVTLSECSKISRKDKCKKSGNMMMAAGAVAYDSDDSFYMQPPAYNTEEFDKIDETGFLAAMTNPVSTFSVDVDNAAYSNIRRYLNSNQLPPKDLVRIEEMINYFGYDYPESKDKTPFSITMEMGDCPWNTKHQLVHIGLKGKDIDQNNIPASNLVFLVDVSGSMNSDNKLGLLKSAFKILVNKLRQEDRVAMVVYAGAAGVVLESTSGADKVKITTALDNLSAGGSTAGGAGIKLAYKIAKENFIQDGNNRVILATDGDFNVGASSDGDMVRLIEEKRDDGIFLTVLGFGMGNYKDSKMEKISNAGNGNYAYIDNVLEAKKVLGEEMWGTLYTIAKDVKIQVEFNPAKVKGYRLIGYENRMLAKEDFDDDKKDAGEIGVGHTVTALYEIIPAGSDEKVADGGNLEYQKTTVVNSNNLMTVKLRYKQPDGDTSMLIEQRITEGNITSKKPTANFNFSAAVAEFGLLLRDSEFKGNSSYENVVARAKTAKGLDKDGYRAEFIKMVEVAQIVHDTASK